MSTITVDRLMDIMKGQSDYESFQGTDRCFEGLKILSKYHHDVIQGAGYDIVWSFDLSDAIEYGLSESDAILLRRMGWVINPDNECLAKFV